jgi:hypothetical protein
VLKENFPYPNKSSFLVLRTRELSQREGRYGKPNKMQRIRFVAALPISLLRRQYLSLLMGLSLGNTAHTLQLIFNGLAYHNRSGRSPRRHFLLISAPEGQPQSMAAERAKSRSKEVVNELDAVE